MLIFAHIYTESLFTYICQHCLGGGGLGGWGRGVWGVGQGGLGGGGGGYAQITAQKITFNSSTLHYYYFSDFFNCFH